MNLGRNRLEKTMRIFFLLCGIAAIVAVMGITIYMIISGLPGISEIGIQEFLLGKVWKSTASEPQFGILPFILSSVYAAAGAMAIGIPIGLMTAVYLSKVARPKVASVLSLAVELLAGIPSVVYGLIGMLVLVPTLMDIFHLSNGTSLLAVILVLSVMVLPNIISVSAGALSAVPEEYEEGSMALGATKMETVFRVSIPAARSGIAAGVVLGVGRAIGETMAVMMVAGNVANMPSLFKSVTLLTTAVAKEMAYSSGLQREALFSIALVLFIFILILNVLLNYFLKRGEKYGR